jgi:hypothetical protein
MEDQICEEEISEGNSREAVSRSLNSSSSRSTANFTALEAPAFSATLRFLALGRMAGFADERGYPRFLGGVEVRESPVAVQV